MSEILSTPKAVIDALGGFEAAAALSGVKYNAVFEWHRANRIPAKLYVLHKTELEKRGKSATPSVWGMVEESAQ